MVILNTGDATVNLDGWFVCNPFSYWGIPDVDIAPGQGLTLHAGPGADTATDLFATGGFGSLDGDGNGEVELAPSRKTELMTTPSVACWTWIPGTGEYRQKRKEDPAGAGLPLRSGM